MPWLLVLLVLGMVVSGVVGAFEKVVSRLTIIMAFQSLILDMAEMWERSRWLSPSVC